VFGDNWAIVTAEFNAYLGIHGQLCQFKNKCDESPSTSTEKTTYSSQSQCGGVGRTIDSVIALGLLQLTPIQCEFRGY